jgi:hypothetical protein
VCSVSPGDPLGFGAGIASWTGYDVLAARDATVKGSVLFNLTRHSHHDARAEGAYHDLKPIPDAPMMINGYLTTIIVALDR